MESGPNRSAHARDDKKFRYNMSQAIYGSFPSCATDNTPPRRSRAVSPQLASKASDRPKTVLPVNLTLYGQNDTVHSSNSDDNDKTTPNWLTHQSSPPGDIEKMDNIHQSVCLNLTTPCDQTSTTESELWILPELEDCETDSSSSSSSSSPTTTTTTTPAQSSSSPPPPSDERQYSLFLSDAIKAKARARSHLEQLRARLLQADYDGWDFFVARCSDDKKRNEALQALQYKYQSEERLDEEFDLVVLSAVPASC